MVRVTSIYITGIHNGEFGLERPTTFTFDLFNRESVWCLELVAREAYYLQTSTRIPVVKFIQSMEILLGKLAICRNINYEQVRLVESILPKESLSLIDVDYRYRPQACFNVLNFFVLSRPQKLESLAILFHYAAHCIFTRYNSKCNINKKFPSLIRARKLQKN